MKVFRNEQKRIFEEVVREEGQVVLGWREVPVDGTKVGKERLLFVLG